MPLPAPAADPVLTVVESEACHFCADAHEVLEGFATSYPLIVDSIDVRTDAGRALMARHRAPMSPLVLVDGAFLSSGRLPRRKLEKVLKDRSDNARTAVGPSVRRAHHG